MSVKSATAFGLSSGLEPGLVLLNTTSFSGVASQSINDVFSTTYTNYRIVLDISDLTSDTSVFLKLRVSGTDNSLSYYNAYMGITSLEGGFNFCQNNVTNGIYLTTGDSGTDNIYSYTGDILNPFLAKNTLMDGVSSASTSTGVPASVSGSGVHFVATSYTGFTIVAASGNITGTLSLYGYNK